MAKRVSYYIKDNTLDTQEKIKMLDNGCRIAIKRTISDLKTRSNSAVKTAVAKRYGVNARAVDIAKKRAKKGNHILRISGVVVDSISLPYQGRPLTLKHFSMNPKKRPKKLPYQVEATIKDGNRVSIPGAFLAEASGNWLPFQRVGKERKPIEVVHTVSVPQMIENQEVANQIDIEISELAKKRLKNHIDQIIESVKR